MTAASGRAAVDRANGWSSYDSGMCLKWVRGPCWDVGSYFGSAIEAWNGARDKHPGDRTPPVGAPLFYKGNQYGHVVIAKPNAAGMRSTDCHTTGDVSDETIAWIENHWGYTYLGWTGDLNGVTLPLGGTGEGVDDVGLQDPIDEWSPDDGTSDDRTTVGKTLNQARGYAEDAYQRVAKLQDKVAAMEKTLNAIAKAVGA